MIGQWTGAGMARERLPAPPPSQTVAYTPSSRVTCEPVTPHIFRDDSASVRVVDNRLAYHAARQRFFRQLEFTPMNLPKTPHPLAIRFRTWKLRAEYLWQFQIVRDASALVAVVLFLTFIWSLLWNVG